MKHYFIEGCVREYDAEIRCHSNPSECTGLVRVPKGVYDWLKKLAKEGARQ